MKDLNGFGVALYFSNEEEPREITRDELLALKAFDLVWWSPKQRQFRAPVLENENVLRFLKEFRAGRKP